MCPRCCGSLRAQKGGQYCVLHPIMVKVLAVGGKLLDAASESSTLWKATGPVSMYAWEDCMGPTKYTTLPRVIRGQKVAQKWAP